jgi:hypothetical protein
MERVRSKRLGWRGMRMGRDAGEVVEEERWRGRVRGLGDMEGFFRGVRDCGGWFVGLR